MKVIRRCVKTDFVFAPSSAPLTSCTAIDASSKPQEAADASVAASSGRNVDSLMIGMDGRWSLKKVHVCILERRECTDGSDLIPRNSQPVAGQQCIINKDHLRTKLNLHQFNTLDKTHLGNHTVWCKLERS